MSSYCIEFKLRIGSFSVSEKTAYHETDHWQIRKNSSFTQVFYQICFRQILNTHQ